MGAGEFDSRSKGTTQDKQDVGQDTAQHRSLNQTELVLLQSDDPDQELDGVSEGGIEESRDGLRQAHTQLLSRISQELRR